MNREAKEIRDVSAGYELKAVKPMVPEGFKKTEIGVIPEDWDLFPFSDIFEFRNGVNADRGAYGQGIRFINVLEPITYSHIYGPEITGKVTLPETVVALYTVKQGDVLFNRTSETPEELGLASAYLGNERVVFGGFVIRGRFKGKKLDAIYAGYAFRAPSIRKQIIPMGQGAIRTNIGQKNLSLVIALVPSLSEQCAIAAALSDVDALLEELDHLVAKKRDIKQATMRQLLTGQTRLPGFEGEWEEKQLGQLGDFLKGSGIKREEAQSGHLPCVRYGEIYTLHDDIVRDFHSWISKDVAKTAVRVGKGDILFAGSGETKEDIGKCAAIVKDVEAYAGGDIVIFRACAADPKFLGYALNQPAINDQKSRFGQGDAIVHISAASLSRVTLYLPSLREQEVISSVLWDMDTEILALQQRRSKVGALKQAMMQELLTGRTRLVNPTPKEFTNG